MPRRILLASACLLPLAAAGCGAKAEKGARTPRRPPVPKVSITVADLERKTVERTVDVVGTLKGWEEVTVGAKKGGRVLKVLHDFGDTVAPGQPLVELDPVDAKLGLQQAETRYLSDLAKLGVTRKQAEDYLARFGMGEKLLTGEDVDKRIREIPAVVQTRVALERSQQNLNRQVQLTSATRGPRRTSRTPRTTSTAPRPRWITPWSSRARRWPWRCPARSPSTSPSRRWTTPSSAPRCPPPCPRTPRPTRSEPVTFAVVKRLVHEGQMVKEGESLFDLVIQRPFASGPTSPRSSRPT